MKMTYLPHFITMLILIISGTSCQNSSDGSHEKGDPMEEQSVENPYDMKDNIDADEMISDDDEGQMKIYEPSEVDIKPVYSDVCLEVKDEWECTVNSVNRFVQDNINWPKEVIQRNQEGYEEISFVVRPDGELSDIQHIESKKEPCKGCEEAVIEVVEKLEPWKPAEKNGQKVAVRMTLPVQFKPL
ncbi:MAG: energy transducer TonB [Saprospiraceae bacterium]|nr:energy transducer TonB [Saprospiraceae bacterium]